MLQRRFSAVLLPICLLMLPSCGGTDKASLTLGSEYVAHVVVDTTPNPLFLKIFFKQNGSSLTNVNGAVLQNPGPCQIAEGNEFSGGMGTVSGHQVKFTLTNEYTFDGQANADGSQLQGTISTSANSSCVGLPATFDKVF